MNKGIIFAVCAIVIVLATSVIGIYESMVNSPSTQEIPIVTVLPASTPVKSNTYTLGETIYSTNTAEFVFHGIMQTYYGGLKGPDVLTIGHITNWPLEANMQLTISPGNIIQIESVKFKVIDYGNTWIELQQVS